MDFRVLAPLGDYLYIDMLEASCKIITEARNIMDRN